jgi:general secretion pathway protein D
MNNKLILTKLINQHIKAVSLSILIIYSFTTSTFAEDSAQINLRDVEIPTLIETVSRITGKSFVVDPRVKGRVTVVTSSNVTKDELYDTFLSILQVHGFSAVPSGSGIIKVVPSNQAKQQPVPVVGDEVDTPVRKKLVQKRYNNQTKYNKNDEQLIDAFVKKTGIPRLTVNQTQANQLQQKKPRKKHNADELITRVIRVEHVPAAMLVPILRPLVPSTGQLQAYGPSNTIVISDRAANIDRLLQIIKKMDRADDEELEVIKLRYASAKNLAQTIQTLQKSSIKGASSKNKVAADTRTNSLLLSGNKSSRQQVKKIIAKLDTPHATEEKTKVTYLRYAKAEDLAKVLTGFSKTQKTSKPTRKGAAGTQKANIDIQADASTNSLIITADPDVHRNIAKVIRRLDVRRAQVLVEAIIAEVSSGLSKNLGLQLVTGGTVGGSKGLAAGVIGASNFSTAGPSILSGIANPAGLLSSNGGVLGIGVGNNNRIRFGVLLNALAGDAATNILSTPTLIAMDNEEAEIIVGKNVPFVTGSYTGTGGSTTPSNPFQTIDRKDIGLTLKIKPQINEGTTIRLDIEQESSSLEESSQSSDDKITKKRSIKTSVMVEDDQILVLGGLTEDVYRDKQNKVPFLGDLPIIGRVFRSTVTTKDKQNLMVFIHPVIMRDVLSGNSYTRQKYNKLRRSQVSAKITKRGLLPEGGKPFPTNIRSNAIRKMTQAQKKQIIIREQKQRVLAHQRKIRQSKLLQQQNRMSQQRRAAVLQKARHPAPAQTQLKQNKSMPQRLRNVVPQKRKYLQ